MTPQEIDSVVEAELAHIADSPEPQSELRMLYNMKRRRSLGRAVNRQKSPSQVLAECIQYLKILNPNYQFQYDRVFFAESSRRVA